MLTALVGCAPDYSPNTYATNAVQQANKVEPAVVVGYREVKISASGTIGAVSGGAAGGILGAQADASGITSALGAVGGTIVGGLVGTTIEHTTGDTTGWEYIVRKTDGEMLSVTQREPTPIPLGQKVLVITGNQARIVPDYSTAPDPATASAAGKDKKAGHETPATAATPVAASPQTPNGEAAPEPPANAATPVAAKPAATSVSAAPETPPTAPSKPEDAASPAAATPASDATGADGAAKAPPM